MEKRIWMVRTLFTQFAHFIDILYWIFGNITDIQSKLASRNHHTGFDDSGFVHFNLINGGSGCINFFHRYGTKTWKAALPSLPKMAV